MTNEAPQFPDDESRRIQAEIDRIRSGLKWLRAGQVERHDVRPSDGDAHEIHDAAEGAGDAHEASRPEAADGCGVPEEGAGGANDLRSLNERMQSIVDRARMNAERFERLMGRAPETRVITFVEVQEMLAETLAKRKARKPQAGNDAGRRPGAKRK